MTCKKIRFAATFCAVAVTASAAVAAATHPPPRAGFNQERDRLVWVAVATSPRTLESGEAPAPKSNSGGVGGKKRGESTQPFLGTGVEGTGIRRAAPAGPRAHAQGAPKPGDGRVKSFVGGTTEGTGIRKAAPRANELGKGGAKPFLEGGLDGTGIRKAAPIDSPTKKAAAKNASGDHVKPFLGGSQEGTGIRKAAPAPAPAPTAPSK